VIENSLSSTIFQSLNEKGEVIEVSAQWLEFSGYQKKEVLGHHFTDFLNPLSYEKVHKNFPRLKKFGQVNDVRLSFLRKDGNHIDIILNGTSVYKDDGGFSHTYCEIKTLDFFIQSQKNIQELLDKANALNEELVRTKNELLEEKNILKMSEKIANIGYWKTSYTNTKHTWSDELYKIFGYSPQKEPASYSAYLATVHPDDKKRVHLAFMNLVKRKTPLNITHRGIRPNGSVYYVRNQGQAFTDKTGDMVALLGTVFDITHEKNIQEELQKAKEQAEIASAGKAQFLANMSHEIRTPMNAILGFVDILAKQEDKPEKQKQFDIIKSSGNALLHIINDILDFSKIQSSKLSIDSIAFDPKEAFENTIMLYTQLAHDKHINFNYSISSEFPKHCLGDEIRLKQVMSNLISNAIKFTPENGYIQVNANYVENKMYVSVEDSGVGIQADKLEHIFNMFEQEDNSITRNFGGTGLGLAISKELVEMMQGELLVRSQVGYGSHFNFHIALKPTQYSLEEEVSQESVPLQGKVLLVEDNKSNQLLMGIFLEELGLEYDIANDGQEAVDMVKQYAYDNLQYDAILMDENMPNMNGTQATKEIRDFEKDLQNKSIIIAVTANALSSDKDYFLDAGMNDYVSKPVNQEKIESVLRKYL